MASMKKIYGQAPAILWNLISDIAEMRKGRVTKQEADSLTLQTEMYGIETVYQFHVARAEGGTQVTVETPGDHEEDERRVLLMFVTLENLLAPFCAPKHTDV